MNEEAELVQALIRNACVNDGSSNPQEVRNADAVTSVLEAAGCEVSVVDAAPGRRSVVSRWPGTDPDAPALMLLGHTDVVPADASRWRFDPYAADVHDGFIWGRGAMDMLGHVATMALAFRDLVSSGRHLPGDVVFAAVADEEALSGYGMEYLVREHRDLVAADWVLGELGGVQVGAPDELKLSVLVGEKGAWRVAIDISGQPGHGSLPFTSDSALAIAAQVVNRFAGEQAAVHLSEDWRQVVQRGWDPSVAEVLVDPDRIDSVLAQMPATPARTVRALTRMTAVPTRVSTEGSWNSMSAHASVEVDVRTVAGQGWEDIVEYFGVVLGEDLMGLADVRLIAHAEASRSPIDTQLWKVLETSARSIVPGAALLPALATGVTDARFMRELGAVAYGFGLFSPRIEASEVPMMLHGDNERVDIKSLEMMRQLWSTIFAGVKEQVA